MRPMQDKAVADFRERVGEPDVITFTESYGGIGGECHACK